MKPQIAGGQIEADEELELFEERILHKKTVIVGSKTDLELADVSLGLLKEHYGKNFPVSPISTRKVETMELLKRKIFEVLEIIRVYTKQPGKKSDLSSPYILPVGSTVEEAAEHVHKDFLEKLKFARLWRVDKFQGQRVQRDFVMEDRDLIELHI